MHDLDTGRVQILSKIEQSKNLRRAAIVTAASDLIRETGDTGLSMRALATRAGVSLATPYNLFGSKNAILVEVMNQWAASLGKHLAKKTSTDKIVRIFEFVDESVSVFKHEVSFSKALLLALYRSEDQDFRTQIQKPALQNYKKMLREAITEGYLDENTSAEYLARILQGNYIFCIQNWIFGSISLERARLEIDHAHSVIMLSAATSKSKRDLAARRARYQKALVNRRWKKP